jgi:hypothetical protein
MKNTFMNQSLLVLLAVLLLAGCAPQREFVRFGDAGTFRPGPQPGAQRNFSGPDGEYDSYELIDHGAPNHGVPPMYSGQPSHQGGGYPAAVPTYDAYGNPQTIIVPNPW